MVRRFAGRVEALHRLLRNLKLALESGVLLGISGGSRALERAGEAHDFCAQFAARERFELHGFFEQLAFLDLLVATRCGR